MTKVTGVSPIDIETASGAHAMMVNLRSYLLAAGLTEVAITDGYDASETGSADQLVLNVSDYASWMVFTFSDEANQQFPIYVSFRVTRQAVGSSSNSYARYLIQSRVSTDINAETGAASANVALSSVTGNYSSSSNYAYYNAPNLGDFIRYTGDALTVVFGAGAATSQNLGKRDAIVYLHVERQVQLDGTYTGGPAILINSNPFYSAGYGSSILNPAWSNGGDCLVSGRAFSERTGGVAALFTHGIPIVAPVFYKSASRDELVPFRYLFSIPAAPVLGAGLIRLDFQGEEKQYLRTSFDYPATYGFNQIRIGYQECVPLFSWDD
mgnify:CR=1 FL=1